MPILATEFPTFQRAMRIISSITKASPCTVTTTFDHQYITGMIVRLNLPPGFGMEQANQKYASITVTSDTAFTMDLDTRLFEPFAAPTTFPLDRQYAQVTPMGSENYTLAPSTKNVLPYTAT